MKRLCIVICLFLNFAFAETSSDHIRKVEEGLLPPLPVNGERTWTLTERMKYYNVPGVSIALIDQFKIAWARGYGIADRSSGAPVTTETLFQASSMSKTITAAAAIRLAEKHVLNLDAPIESQLKSWKLPASEFKKPITLRMLLSHRAGLNVPGFPGFEQGETLPTILEQFDGLGASNTQPLRIVMEPGTKFRYSGGGYLLAQQLMMDVTGKSFDEIIRTEILEPLGMKHSYYNHPPSAEQLKFAAAGHDENGDVIAGKFRIHTDLAASGLWTTPSDYALFIIALQNSIKGKPNSLLTAASAKAMITAENGPMGIGVFASPRKNVNYMVHPGNNWGFYSIYFAHPQNGYGVVVFANHDNGSALVNEIVRAVAHEHRWQDFLPMFVNRTQPSIQDLDSCIGRYKISTDDVLSIRRSAHHLIGSTTFSNEFELFPVGKMRFVHPEEAITYNFENQEVSITNDYSFEGFGEETNKAVRMNERELTPSELLDADKTEEALALLETIVTQDSAAIDSSVLVSRAQALIHRGKPKAAFELMTWTSQKFPGIASVYDAMAEAASALNDNDHAIEASQKVLEALKTDFSSTASWRVVFKKRALQRIQTGVTKNP
jgi:CubicO group peptidase (beta-lactamase class C family)